MKTIKNKTAFRLLYNIVCIIPIKKHGVYDVTDPTYFEKGEIKFQYDENDYIFKFFDSTWGIEISIIQNTPLGIKKIASFYLDEEGILLRQKGFCGCLLILAKTFPEVLHPNFISKREQ